MRRVRMAVCLVFVVSCVVFGIYMVKTRMVEDHTPPQISCEEDTIEVSVDAEESEILKGVTAKDNKDGDITKDVTISSMSHFIAEGKRMVEYIVFDKANNPATVQRNLIYKDYTSPKIYLSKSLRYELSQVDKVNLRENVTVEDCLDGDLTSQLRIVLGDSYYSDEPGEYPIDFEVSNSAGDVRRVTIPIEVVDGSDRRESQKIYPMLSEYIVYTKVGETISTKSYLTGVIRNRTELSFEKDGDYIGFGAEAIAVQSNVDYSKPGMYTVEYSCVSEEGVKAVTKLYVVVEE